MDAAAAGRPCSERQAACGPNSATEKRQDMNERRYNTVNVLLTAAGVVFSGYMSSVRFFSDQCAFDEPCPYFLGYPACYYGFGLFLAMFIASGLAVAGVLRSSVACQVRRISSGAGILFAGYMASQEVIRHAGSGGSLGLPTCVYGLVFFIAIFAVSFMRSTTVSAASLTSSLAHR